MKLWKCGNGRVPRLVSHVPKTFGIFIFSYFHIFTIAQCAVFAAPATFDASVWRGETAYVAIPEAIRDKAATLAELNTEKDISLTPLRFDEVKYDLVERYKDNEGKMKARITGKGSVPDVCREWKMGDGRDKRVPPRPTMIKITVAPEAKPGKYDLGPLELTVIDRVLPPAKDWKYFLDLWQHPWAVSRYFGVKPFSPEHYAKMEPVWRALADCGCKALTVTLLDLPWNNQCYDGYHSMIGRVKTADGKWKFDYKLFDEYVAFGRKCGLGPDIACYTMCPWGYMASWREEEAGEVGDSSWSSREEEGMVERREKILPGTPEFEDYWGDFLVDFEKHVKEKGWLGDTYIAMDERKPEDVRKIIELIQKKSPGLKVAMAGNKSPAEFSGMKIDNYCQGLIHLRKHPQMLEDLEPRRRNGCKTTFYVCATAMHPNTFMDSPLDEGFWLGAYPGVSGFDGFLRWAANSWPENPYDDASFKTIKRGNLHWRPGDTFLVYPGGELSARIIALRAGVVAAEKLRIISEQETGNREQGGVGVSSWSSRRKEEMRRLAEKYGYKEACGNKIDFSAFRHEVEAFVNNEVSRSPLRVMSYNIRCSGRDDGTVNGWDGRKEDLAGLIERESPDAVGFQEVLPEQMEFLKSRLKAYTFIGEYRNADRKSGEASPVAFKSGRFRAVKCGTFWLSETPDTAGSISWGAKYPRVCSYAVLDDAASGRRFAFANTHTDHKSEEAREKGMLLVIKRMKEFAGDVPIVFTGDHNCLEFDKCAMSVKEKLKDALYLSETPPDGPWRTCTHWVWREQEISTSDALKLPPERRSAKGDDAERIDYIYVTPGTKVLAYRTIPASRPELKLYPSDHFPIVADIVLRGRK